MTVSSWPTWKIVPRVLMQEVNFSGWNWMSVGAFAGLSLGIISPLLGSSCTAISWFTGPLWHGFAVHHYGTVLLFLTIPFLVFGAHCLDLMEKQNKTSRLASQERQRR